MDLCDSNNSKNSLFCIPQIYPNPAVLVSNHHEGRYSLQIDTVIYEAIGMSTFLLAALLIGVTLDRKSVV